MRLLGAVLLCLWCVIYQGLAVTNIYQLGPHQEFEISVTYTLNPYIVVKKVTILIAKHFYAVVVPLLPLANKSPFDCVYVEFCG